MELTISVTIDVPDGMESAVHDAAQFALVTIGDRMKTKTMYWHGMANQLQNLVPHSERPVEVQKAIDVLRAQAQRERAATEHVQLILSEVTLATNKADMEYRRRQFKRVDE